MGYITVELEVLFEVGIYHSPSVFSLHPLTILLVVPALTLIKGHEEQRELPHVCLLLVHCAFSTH